MASLSLFGDRLLVSLNREVLLVDFADGLSTRSLLTLPPPPAIVKNVDDALKASEADEQDDPPANETHHSDRILDTAFSRDTQLLAIATGGEKALYLYRLDGTDGPELLSRRDLNRTSKTIRFGSNGLLFVADKTGDCFTYECLADSVNAPPKWILAHFSMVLDILPSSSFEFILTCDRDEKIRCTKFPESNLIESYCLGHTEYVAAIDLLPTHSDDLLVSISGDKTMRIWKYIEGTQLASYPLPAAALKMAIHQFGQVNHVAVTLVEHEETFVVYEIRAADDDDGRLVCNRLSGHVLPDVKEISSILFDGSGLLVVAAVTTADTLQIYTLLWSPEANAYVLQNGQTLNAGIERASTSLAVSFDADEIGLLFKKKFDNIIDYHERKKRRIDEKTKTKGI